MDDVFAQIHKHLSEVNKNMMRQLERARDLAAEGKVPEVWCLSEAANRAIEAEMWLSRALDRAKAPR